MTIKTVHIFDLDGVAIDSLHRYRLGENGRIDLPHWVENCTPEMIALDGLLPHAALLTALINDPTAYVVIATARVCQEADFNYVEKHIGKPDLFICREMGDHTGGADLKIKGLRFINNLKQFRNAVRYVYEDNLDYLHPIAKVLNATAIFVPSEQGY